jgi:hypothetical protein
VSLFLRSFPPNPPGLLQTRSKMFLRFASIIRKPIVEIFMGTSFNAAVRLICDSDLSLTVAANPVSRIEDRLSSMESPSAMERSQAGITITGKLGRSFTG